MKLHLERADRNYLPTYKSILGEYTLHQGHVGRDEVHLNDEKDKSK